MGIEIDFLPVEPKSGNAIAIRYGNLDGNRVEQTIIIIDGGNKDSGNKLVEHIKKYYNTNIIDHVILTHLHSDHASGLKCVLENLVVRKLWMHLPFEHVDKKDFQDKRITENSLISRIEESLNNLKELQELADEKKIEIIEPFSDTIGKVNNELTILGPSLQFYEDLIPRFKATPEPKEEKLYEKIKQVIRNIFENWTKDTLCDPSENETDAENDSSVILLLNYDNALYLFTGDAGVLALEQAFEKVKNANINPHEIKFLQIPHHGSKYNIGPTILNKIVGKIIGREPLENDYNKVAFVSSSKNGDLNKEGIITHPSPQVVNAFMRRGVKVFATKGIGLRHHYKAPIRDGWTKATNLQFEYTLNED